MLGHWDTCLRPFTSSRLGQRPERGWLLTARAPPGVAGTPAAPLPAKGTQPHFVNTQRQSPVKPSRDGSGTHERVKGWAISCAGHLGNHSHPHTGRRRYLGASQERPSSFPKAQRTGKRHGGPRRQVFQTEGRRGDRGMIPTLRYTLLPHVAVPSLPHNRAWKDGKGDLPKHRRRSGLIFSQQGTPLRGPHPGHSKAAWIKQYKP